MAAAPTVTIKGLANNKAVVLTFTLADAQAFLNQIAVALGDAGLKVLSTIPPGLMLLASSDGGKSQDSLVPPRLLESGLAADIAGIANPAKGS